MSKRPILIGIVGDSAAGKTTISKGLADVLGNERVTHVCVDDYHKYDRQERAQLGISPLHPDCNYIDIMELHLERMHYGQPFLKPVYDHSNGTLTRPQYVVPQEFVIVEGLLGFSTSNLRQFFDVKVYLDPPETLRRAWKVKRDTSKRGYTPEQVLASLEKRETDSRDFIRPQREFADMVVRFYPPSDTSTQDANTLNTRLVLRPTIPHPDLTYLTQRNGSGICLELGRDGSRPVDFLDIEGTVATEHASELEAAIWEHLPNLHPVQEGRFGKYLEGTVEKHSHPLALTQLLITYHLLRKYNDVSDVPFAAPIAALSRLQVEQTTDH
jgi:phosphoribulokinase